MITSEAARRKTIRLELRFIAPEVYAPTQSPRYKIAIMLLIVIFCMLNSWSSYPPNCSRVCTLLHLLIVIVTQVCLLTYLTTHFLARIFSRWLLIRRWLDIASRTAARAEQRTSCRTSRTLTTQIVLNGIIF